MSSAKNGGEGGIRTPDTVARMPHFECGAFNHSATSPNPDFAGFVRLAGGARSALCYAFARLSAIAFSKSRLLGVYPLIRSGQYYCSMRRALRSAAWPIASLHCSLKVVKCPLTHSKMRPALGFMPEHCSRISAPQASRTAAIFTSAALHDSEKSGKCDSVHSARRLPVYRGHKTSRCLDREPE